MNENQSTSLGTAPLGRLLFRLALPAVTAQFINMLYNMVDRIYIGHMPVEGTMALTGLGICMPIIIVVSAFAALVSMGGAPRASIFMGRGQPQQAEQILGGCFVLQLGISAALTVLLELFQRPLLLAFGGSANTIGYAVDYLSIYALGTVFVQVTLGMNAFITAQGFAKTGMVTVLIGAVCNIVLDPILIFGCHMGVRGAALATILSQAVSAVWATAFLCGKKTVLRLRRENLRLSPKVVLPCLALGAAPFVMQASESVISVCFNASLLKYGSDIAVGAMTILTSVMQFAMLPIQGIAQGAQPITSYNFGAGNRSRVRQSFWLLLRCTCVYSAALWAAVMLFPRAFASIFSPNAALVEFTAGALRIYGAMLGLMGVQVACQMTFISLGNARASILVAVMRKFVLLIPLIYLLPAVLPGSKVSAVYLAEPVADALAVTFTAVLFAFQFRRALRGMGPEPPCPGPAGKTA